MIEIGQTVGNYTITAKLGEGGMGTVFLAEHPMIGSKVALKAIHPQYAGDQDVLSRFMNEAKAVNRIGHDHIVDITDFGSTPEGSFYFIMEYLEGQSLLDCILRAGRLRPARALGIAAQIADALAASHAYGVVHRDLKPENIFLIVRYGVEDFVKVLDFGLAKLTRVGEASLRNTGQGYIMGSPCYMSPEQCEGKADVDHRADIYALGVILFEMLTGKVPFGGHSNGEILLKHVRTPAPAARSIVPELSPALDMILFRALAKDPAMRFQTMAELREALLAPEAYASLAVVPGALEDLSVRVRVAMPMARKEIHLRPMSGSGVLRGEVGADDADLKPRRHLARTVVLVGIAALAGMGIAVTKHRLPFTRAWSAVTSLRAPSAVVVAFDSAPDGATVARADGAVLGVTPLRVEIAFGPTPLECVIRKDGYLAKTTFVAADRPSTHFAVLEKAELPPLPEVEAPLPPEEPPTADAPAPNAPSVPVRRSPRHHARPRATERGMLLESDRDEVLEPSFR